MKLQRKCLFILFDLLLVFSNVYIEVEALSSNTNTKTSPIISARWEKHSSSSPSPPRSGHVAFHLGNVPFIFGGYAEETDSSNGKERYVVNDLWKFISFEKGWEKVPYDNNNKNKLTPRLVAAAARLEDKAVIFGGWDPQVAGTGGEILEDVFSFECSNHKNDSICLDNQNLPPFPTGPTSRHVAVSLDDSTILIHDFRCNEYVWLFTMDEKWIQQPVKGSGPSSRGLHCASILDGKHVLLFGGSDKQGQMSCETFLLDTNEWEWTKIEPSSADPCGRAGASLVSLSDQSGAILFGGAKSTDGGGLQGLNDLWYFSLDTKTWTEIQVVDSIPPGRNAATLSLLNQPDTDDNNDIFLLCGGWQPFVETHNDVWSLHITKSK